MKTIKIIGIGIYLCLLQNCTPDKIVSTYRLENGTLHEIKMEFYSNGGYQRTRQIIGQGLIFEGSARSSYGRLSQLSPEAAFGADSIIVIFDHTKIIQYYLLSGKLTSIPKTNRNTLDDQSYEVLSNELYRFVFTEEDYENAEDCNGECG